MVVDVEIGKVLAADRQENAHCYSFNLRLYCLGAGQFKISPNTTSAVAVNIDLDFVHFGIVAESE